MAKDIKSFLGTGWSFPPSFDKPNASVLMVSDVADIEESIRIILSTIPGERTMLPDFGCNIRKLVFEVADSRFSGELNHLIYHALLEYEPRIKLVDSQIVDQTMESGTVYVQINYTVISTNTRHNLVYPFYFLEGTNISTR
ncbi:MULTISPECIES: GPW/gp25 family protein [Chitinophaga]|jgi:Bacteriophage baseplate protein W|uniref:GPW/gp25 family protein n=1 Tax=Chitinophaga TaxID=79328 RepID=UPI000DBAA425|nr:GPW/gp25 family protein [Chitinophaga ginsengisegetis]MDR6570907.1 phage baseplate assembly protein W [Chitinophaga ginsengisegetis]MDR6650641.1 phage baseplate assembly protein W [Chitinophaga ginsengisegetis]MDR6656991.1 phage baseplate assembly protein W [Chitinophaga ginsengisegetis]